MHAWESIQAVVNYIEENLDEELSVETLAGVAALSPFYFQRLFSRLVKRPVVEYIRLRRLARAAKQLANSGLRVGDIAREAGFESHEGFTRAFKAAYGFTPEGYRANPVALLHFEKPAILLSYTMVDEGVPLVVDGIVLEVDWRELERPLQLIGNEAEISNPAATPPGEVTGPDDPAKVWHTFHEREKPEGLFAKPWAEWGASHFGAAAPGSFVYFGGAEAAGAMQPPAGWAGYTLQPGRYVVCKIEAESVGQLLAKALDTALNYMLGTWLAGRGLQCQPFSAERYLPVQGDVHNMELWLLPVV